MNSPIHNPLSSCGGPAAEGEARSSRPFILGSVTFLARGLATAARENKPNEPAQEGAGARWNSILTEAKPGSIHLWTPWTVEAWRP